MRKKIIITITLIIFMLSISYSQITSVDGWNSIKNDANNFKTIPNDYETYIYTLYPDGNFPDDILKEVKQYYRYYHDWAYRLGVDNNDNLELDTYLQAALNFSQSTICENDQIAQWQLLGPTSYTSQYLGLVNEVLGVVGNSSDILISSNHGGLWKKQSAGNTWANVIDNLRYPGLSATELVRNPFNNQHILAATGNGLEDVKYGLGIIESFDNGLTWSVMDDFPYETNPYSVKIVIDQSDSNPNDGLTFYVITLTKIFKTTNTGANWVEITGPGIGANHFYYDAESDINGNFYVSTKSRWTVKDSHIYKFNGTTWQDLSVINSLPGGARIKLTKPYNGKFFLLIDDAASARHIYKTNDFGNSFVHIINGNNENNYFNGQGKCEIEYSPMSNIVYTGSFSLYYFKDDGVYNVVDKSVGHVDIRDIEFLGVNANNKEELLVANDGGLSFVEVDISNLSNLTYSNLNGNHLPITNFYGLGAGGQDGEFIVAGAIHNHSYKLENNNWTKFHYGDGGDCAVNWLDNEYYYYQGNSNMSSSKNQTLISGNPWFIGMNFHINQNNPYEVLLGRPGKIVICDEINDNQTHRTLPSQLNKAGAIYVDCNNSIYVSDYSFEDSYVPNRIVKSTDGGLTWPYDLGSSYVYNIDGSPTNKTLQQLISWKTIRSIVGNPNNENELYVGIGGVYNENSLPVSEKYRVLHSTDGGSSWYDISSGLPAFPINKLLLIDNGEQYLFAATDVGVFYKSTSMNQFECFQNGMPVAIATDLDYDYCSNTLYVSTDGRGIYKSDIPFAVPDITISNNTTWKGLRYGLSDITVTSGATLTIKGYLLMSEGNSITIEPGGQLLVDGGTITNACGDFWQGIVVVGQQNQPQTTQYQGAVRLMNGATIENAVYGVQLFDRQTDGEPAESTAGGLLIATDAIFKNNKTAITAGYYNYSGSYIQNCDFIIDGDYYESSSSQPFFVDLHSINAFYFRGNHFKNEVTDVSVSTSQLPIGIRSYNAGLQIKLGNIFENLQYGVKATENNFSNVSEISSNTFTKNLTGIYMSGVSAPQIFYNDFEAIPFNTALPIDQTFTGVYLDGVQGHSVEENTFYSNLSGIPDKQHPCIGLVVNNGGTQDVEVYLNTFEYLDFAILAQNNNRSSNGLNGLCIKCNEFNYNGSDVSVTAGPLIPASLAGIALNQGSGAADDNAPAGNLFSELNSNLQWQFNNINGVDHLVTYWHHDPTGNPARLVPNPNYINNVLPVMNSLANYNYACQPKQVGGGSGGIGKTETMALLDDSQSEFESTESTLLSLTDEGNTPALQTEVNTSTPNESYELRNELLDVAPYTSEEVLIDATEKEDVLTDALIRDVLVANPQAAKSDEVLEAIENRSAAMPQYMKDQIAAGALVVSEKEELEAKSFYFKTAYTNALNDLVFIYMSDTTLSNPLDSVIAQLDAANYLYAKYQLANIYLTLNEFESLNALISSIPENFFLKDELLTEYEQLSDYFEIMIDLHNSNRNINQLTESEITDLTYWYENESNLAANWALNVLRESGNISYQEPYILPDDELKSSTIQIQSSGSTGTGNHELLQVYPNPANDYMVCEYQLDRVYSRASISMLQSGSAKAVFTKVLENSQDALVIDLAEYKAGNYLLMLIVDGKTIETKSINIIK